MCEPISMTALAIGSTLYAANQQAKAANDANRQIEKNYNTNLGQLDEQRKQMQRQQAEEDSAIAKSARAEIARMAVLAGENGSTGGSFNRVLTEHVTATQDAQAMSQRNLDNALVQSQREAEAMRSNARAQTQRGPDWVGVGLQIGGQAAGGYAKYTAAQDARLKTQTTTKGGN